MRVVAAVDKFRGSATAPEVAAAIGSACWEAGHDCVEIPMADGGDGLLAALGGANRTTTVTGPLGTPTEAAWRLSKRVAVIEMALASGLTLAGGATQNNPLTATTRGTGELIDAALNAGAKRIIVGLGGSATTDGGHGALDAISAIDRLHGVDLLVACDVDTTFCDAAAVFAPQKGATPAQVAMLTRRLDTLADKYEQRFGTPVRDLVGSGAAGGLAGALAAVGGTLVPGFDLVADEVDLYDALEDADLVLTGEGHLDAQSFNGKVVGGVQNLAAEYGIPVGAIVGVADDDVTDRIPHWAIAELYGSETAWNQPLRAISDATRLALATYASR